MLFTLLGRHQSHAGAFARRQSPLSSSAGLSESDWAAFGLWVFWVSGLGLRETHVFHYVPAAGAARLVQPWFSSSDSTRDNDGHLPCVTPWHAANSSIVLRLSGSLRHLIFVTYFACPSPCQSRKLLARGYAHEAAPASMVFAVRLPNAGYP